MSLKNPPSTTATTPHYADNPSAFPMEGGCCCGYVRYRLDQAPMAVHCCHCTACQRETGSAFGINVIIETTNVTILPPAPATIPAHPGCPNTFPPAGPNAAPSSAAAKSELIRAHLPQESGEPHIVTHCPRCLTAVWSEYSIGPAVTFVRQGTLDRAWLVQPDLHLYVRSKREFFAIDDGKAQFEEFYDRTKVWTPESLERWDRLLPEIRKYRESFLEKAGTAGGSRS